MYIILFWRVFTRYSRICWTIATRRESIKIFSGGQFIMNMKIGSTIIARMFSLTNSWWYLCVKYLHIEWLTAIYTIFFHEMWINSPQNPQDLEATIQKPIKISIPHFITDAVFLNYLYAAYKIIAKVFLTFVYF